MATVVSSFLKKKKKKKKKEKKKKKKKNKLSSVTTSTSVSTDPSASAGSTRWEGLWQVTVNKLNDEEQRMSGLGNAQPEGGAAGTSPR